MKQEEWRERGIRKRNGEREEEGRGRRESYEAGGLKRERNKAEEWRERGRRKRTEREL